MRPPRRWRTIAVTSALVAGAFRSPLAAPATLSFEAPPGVADLRITWAINNGSGIEHALRARVTPRCHPEGATGERRVCEVLVPDKRERAYVITPLLAGRPVQGGAACIWLLGGWKCLPLSECPWTQEAE